MRHEPFHELTPERAFVRQWALTLLDRTMAQLEAEASSKSKSSLFDLVKPAILETDQHASYAEIAARLGTTETVVKVAVHRYRSRFRVLLRQEIARTVDDPADIEEEISTLIQALALSMHGSSFRSNDPSAKFFFWITVTSPPCFLLFCLGRRDERPADQHEPLSYLHAAINQRAHRPEDEPMLSKKNAFAGLFSRNDHQPAQYALGQRSPSTWRSWKVASS